MPSPSPPPSRSPSTETEKPTVVAAVTAAKKAECTRRYRASLKDAGKELLAQVPERFHDDPKGSIPHQAMSAATEYFKFRQQADRRLHAEALQFSEEVIPSQFRAQLGRPVKSEPSATTKTTTNPSPGPGVIMNDPISRALQGAKEYTKYLEWRLQQQEQHHGEEKRE